jgi:hypothetical protein
LFEDSEATVEVRRYDELLDFDQTIVVTFYLIHKRLNIFVKKIEGEKLVANRVEQTEVEMERKKRDRDTQCS